MMACLTALAMGVVPVRGALLTLTEYFSGVSGIFFLEFNQFNPAWGVLNSVTLTLNLYSDGGVLRFDNDGTLGASGNVRFGSQGFLYSEDITGDSELDLVNAIARSGNIAISVSADDGDAEVGGTSNFSFSGSDYAQVIGGKYTGSRTEDVTDYADAFYGTATFTVTAEALQYVTASAFGGAQQFIDPSTVSGSVIVAYNYSGSGPPPPAPDPEPDPDPNPDPQPSAVPEPSTMLLMSMTMFLLRVLRVHRRKPHVQPA